MADPKPILSPIRWERDLNNHRTVAFCGSVAVGAVFDLPIHGRYIRWRAWVTVRSTPVEGANATVAGARAAVEERFDTFLKVAGLTRANPEGEAS